MGPVFTFYNSKTNKSLVFFNLRLVGLGSFSVKNVIQKNKIDDHTPDTPPTHLQWCLGPQDQTKYHKALQVNLKININVYLHWTEILYEHLTEFKSLLKTFGSWAETFSEEILNIHFIFSQNWKNLTSETENQLEPPGHHSKVREFLKRKLWHPIRRLLASTTVKCGGDMLVSECI